MALAPETIVCVECGGPCRILSAAPPDEGWQPGDVVAYRCRDCLERWDVILPDDEDDDRA